MIKTRSAALIGQEGYRVDLYADDLHYIDMVDGQDFTFQRDAEAWGLKQVRQRNRAQDGKVYSARLLHIRWVADEYEDEEYGVILSAAVESDESFRSYCDGVTWRDDHDKGGPFWEAM